MEKRRGSIPIIVIICAAFLLILVSGLGRELKDEKFQVTADKKKATRNPTVSVQPSFVTQKELSAALAKKEGKPRYVEGRIVSAIMPHHLVADRLIVNAMATIAQQEPSLVILVGPNHFNKGERIITGVSSWQTPTGILDADQSLVKALIDKRLAVTNEEVLSREHSVGALVPFVKYFLPEAKILPIVLHHDVSIQEIEGLLSALDPYLEQNAVLISSVDFSHYLIRSEAQAKDQETLEAMKNFDYATLLSLNNDYVDSPISLCAAFRWAEKEGISDLIVLDNTNSGIILQNDTIETTSYFTIVFTR